MAPIDAVDEAGCAGGSVRPRPPGDRGGTMSATLPGHEHPAPAGGAATVAEGADGVFAYVQPDGSRWTGVTRRSRR